MTILERIEADFIAAYKNKESEKKNFLGLLKSEIKADEGRGILSTDDNVIKRLKSIEKGLLQVMGVTKIDHSAEIDILREYLPKMLDESTIREVIKGIMMQDGSGLKEVMLHFKETYPGQVDNKRLSEIAREYIK